MREVLFKGLRVDGKGWKEGYFVKDFRGDSAIFSGSFDDGSDPICWEHSDVIPETVRQYTGIKDSGAEKAKVWGGDIIQDDSGSYTYEIRYSDEHAGFIRIRIEYKSIMDNHPLTQKFMNECDMLVVGNIHQNPELLK